MNKIFIIVFSLFLIGCTNKRKESFMNLFYETEWNQMNEKEKKLSAVF